MLDVVKVRDSEEVNDRDTDGDGIECETTFRVEYFIAKSS